MMITLHMHRQPGAPLLSVDRHAHRHDDVPPTRQMVMSILAFLSLVCCVISYLQYRGVLRNICDVVIDTGAVTCIDTTRPVLVMWGLMMMFIVTFGIAVAETFTVVYDDEGECRGSTYHR